MYLNVHNAVPPYPTPPAMLKSRASNVVPLVMLTPNDNVRGNRKRRDVENARAQTGHNGLTSFTLHRVLESKFLKVNNYFFQKNAEQITNRREDNYCCNDFFFHF